MSYTRYGYIFIAPFVIVYAIFSLYPLLTTFWYSTTNSQLATADFWGFGDKEIYYDRYLNLNKWYKGKLDTIGVDNESYKAVKNFFILQDLIDEKNPMNEEGIQAIINIGSNGTGISQTTIDQLQKCLADKNFAALTTKSKEELTTWSDANSDLTSVIQSNLSSIKSSVNSAIATSEEGSTTTDLTAESIYNSDAYDKFIETLNTAEFTADQQALMKYLAEKTGYATLAEYFASVKNGEHTIEEAMFYYVCVNLSAPNAIGADGVTPVDKIDIPFLANVKTLLNATTWNGQVVGLNTYSDFDAYINGEKDLHSEDLYNDLKSLHEMGLINVVQLKVEGDTCVETNDLKANMNILAQLREYIDKDIKPDENVNKARLAIGNIKNYINDRDSLYNNQELGGVTNIDQYLTFTGSFDRAKYYDFKSQLKFSEPLNYDKYKSIEKTRKEEAIAKAQQDLADNEAKLNDAQSKFDAAEKTYNDFAKPINDEIEKVKQDRKPFRQAYVDASVEYQTLVDDATKAHESNDESKWTAEEKSKIEAAKAEMDKKQAEMMPYEEKIQELQNKLKNSEEQKSYDAANEELSTIKHNIYFAKQDIAYPDPLLASVDASRQYAFIGAENFAKIFAHKDTFHEVIGSFSTTFIVWIIGFVPQILLALLLSAWFTDTKLHLKGLGLMKALMYLPNVITAVSVAIFFQKIFGYNENPIAYPPANRIVTIFREEPFNFLRNVWSTRLIVCFINFWMWYGNTMIVLIAGITSISESLYESAQIDGATSFQTYTKITMPLLRPILLYTMVTSLIGGLQMFDIPANLNNNPITVNFGGTEISSIQTVLMYINKKAFGSAIKNQVGLASATSVILFVVTVVLSVLIFYIMRDKDAAKAKKRLKKGGTK
jgi:multiple sugar transport system permease protein